MSYTDLILSALLIEAMSIMETFYIVILVFLACLAAFDLFVGVSNDAVNFLNSALGCRIASFKTTMIVTSLGVLLGATFSSGMMEIARSGVFRPQMFTFHEIMIIFFAVMVADIILLDVFNSLGLPTSTTVSIVFELLGSAIAAAAFKLLSDGESIGVVIDYINSSKALTIVSGILVSVVVAFVTGAISQFIARLIFTFRFENTYRRIGAIFGSLAITSIIYFLIFKGAKGASFMRPEWLLFMKEHTLIMLGAIFVLATVFFQIGIVYFKLNVFKIVILAGTFSLAFAFAGNDLVNFVGVPLAAFDSWNEWVASGVPAQVLMMGGLLKPSIAPTALLLLSGLVMVLTLWFSKKAHRVIQTSINLSSSQSGEHEQFGSSLPGRLIVRASLNLGNVVHQILPGSFKKGIGNRFKAKAVASDEDVLPFDYVRASINLMVSSILIASATSLKLPLSTTYVTFMVAMGSSFADGAWDRESAVYRISGVLAVISGWFLTAFSACVLAFIACYAVLWGGPYIGIVLGIVAMVLVVRSNLKKDPETDVLAKIGRVRYDVFAVKELMVVKSQSALNKTLTVFSEIIDGFFADDERALKQARNKSNELYGCLSKDRALFYRMSHSFAKSSQEDDESRYCYYRAMTSMREVSRSLLGLASLAKDHVANRHPIYGGHLRYELVALRNRLSEIVKARDISLDKLHDESKELSDHIEMLLASFLRGLPKECLSMRGCEIYLNCIIFIRVLVSHYKVVYSFKKRIALLADKAEELRVKDSIILEASAGKPAITCVNIDDGNIHSGTTVNG